MHRALILATCFAMLPLAGCASSDAPPVTSDDACAAPEAVRANRSSAGNPLALVCTNHGLIVIELFGEKAPQTVKNFGTLAQDAYYDGVKFHRVIGPGPRYPHPDGFMLQAGDPNTKDDSKQALWGTGGPGYTILDEFYCADGSITNALPADCELGLKFRSAGQLAMANTGGPRTGGSQFFITLSPTSHLNGRHTIFGEVIHGMHVVREIGRVPTDAGDRPLEAVVIESLVVDGELPAVELQKFTR